MQRTAGANPGHMAICRCKQSGIFEIVLSSRENEGLYQDSHESRKVSGQTGSTNRCATQPVEALGQATDKHLVGAEVRESDTPSGKWHDTRRKLSNRDPPGCV